MRSLLQPIIALLSVHAGTVLGGVLLPIVMTRFLGAEALGIFTAAASLALLFLTIIDWGYETRLPLLVAESPQTASLLVSEALQTKIRLWAIIALFCGVYAAVESFWGKAVSLPMICYVLWALGRSITSTYTASLRGLQQFGVIANIENSFTLSGYLLALGFVVMSADEHQTHAALIVCGVVMCLVAGEIGKSLCFATVLKKSTPRAAPGNTDEYHIVSANTQFFGIPFSRSHLVFVLMQALSILQSRVGIYALTLFAVPSELGNFSAVARFTIAMRILPGTVFNVLLPHFVRSSDIHTFRKVLGIGLAAGVLGSGVVSWGAEILIETVYGARFLHLAPLLQIAAWMFLLQTLGHIVESYLLAIKQERFINTALVMGLSGCGLASVILSVNSAVSAVWLSLGLEAALLLMYCGKLVLIWKTGTKEEKFEQ